MFELRGDAAHQAQSKWQRTYNQKTTRHDCHLEASRAPAAPRHQKLFRCWSHSKWIGDSNHVFLRSGKQHDENRHELNCSPWDSGQQAQSGLPGITTVGKPESRHDLTTTNQTDSALPNIVQSRPRHNTAVSVTWRGLRLTEVSTACSFGLPLSNTSSHERGRRK